MTKEKFEQLAVKIEWREFSDFSGSEQNQNIGHCFGRSCLGADSKNRNQSLQ